MGEERDLDVGIDAGGGSAGGGSGGSGGGSWSVLGRGGGLPEEPDNDDRAAQSTRPYDLDRFDDRTVPPPVRTDGGVIFAGAFGDPLVVTTGVDLDEVTAEGPSVSLTPTVLWIRSTVGQPDGGYVPANSHRGWGEQETWWSFPIPTHPADMAGITAEVTTFAATGYATAPGVELEVVAMATVPTDVRQGTVVAIIPTTATDVEVFIPGDLIPLAGADMYVGIRPRWQADYGQRSHAFTWPWLSSSSQLDDAGVPYQGHSGKVQASTIANATWQTWTSGTTDIGSTSAIVEADAPMDGEHPWIEAGETGDPLIELDPAVGLSVESTAPASRGWLLRGPEEDDDAGDGAWSAFEGWRVEALFRVDAAGLTDQAGTRGLELVTVAEGQRAVVTAHLGDMVRASGISADGGSTVDYEAVDVAADTLYMLVADIRSGEVCGKLWPFMGDLSEPARWNVRAPLASTSDDTSDRFELWFRVGNVTGSQRLTVRRLRQYPSARPGEVVVGELIGQSDGSASSFYTAHPYVPGSLMPASLGGICAARDEWGDEARFRLDHKPPPTAIIRARYVVAAPASVDEGE